MGTAVTPTDCYKSQRSTDSHAKTTLIDILFTIPFRKRNAVLIYILTFRIGWKTRIAECGVLGLKETETTATQATLM